MGTPTLSPEGDDMGANAMFYDAMHRSTLSNTVAALKHTSTTDEEVAVFSGAVAAIFSLMVEGWVSQGVERREAIAKAEFWWRGYIDHLVSQEAGFVRTAAHG
jgi:hypothetical protein